MIIVFAFIFFVFGLIIGSFLNVVIFRLNTQKSFGGRSACMSCMNKLSWYELIPIFSFLGLRGRCRNCQNKISIQYPLVELATGLIFAVLFLKFSDIFFFNAFSFSLSFIFYAAAFSVLLVIAVYDSRHKIIPDNLSFIFGVLAFVGLFLFNNFIFYPHLPSVIELFSGVFIALPFAFFYFISRGKWMGFGDAKLALGIGWLLGFSMALSALIVACWLGALVGLSLILSSQKYGMKSEIPFAPYLVFGSFLALVFGLRLFGF